MNYIFANKISSFPIKSTGQSFTHVHKLHLTPAVVSIVESKILFFVI